MMIGKIIESSFRELYTLGSFFKLPELKEINIEYSNIPFDKIALVVVVLIAALVIRQIIFSLAIKQIEIWADRTETTLDDELVKVVKSTVNVSTYLIVIRLLPLIFIDALSPQGSKTMNGLVQMLTLTGAVFIAYRASLVLGLFASSILIRILGRFTGKTEETIDSNLVLILRQSSRLLIFLLGLWLVQLLFADSLNANLNKTVSSGLNLLTILIIATVIYRSASLLGQLTVNLLLDTSEASGLSELLKQFLPKIIQSIAIIAVVIKIAELFFGASTGALVGLLGGAGLTLGLLFKDIVYDWFCTVIIYTDNLYKEGDWIVVSGLDAMVQVVEIGLRSTSLLSSTRASIQKIPNSQMITGIFQNWSQDAGEEEVWGIPITLKIDGITSQQAARICDGLKDVHESLEGVKEKVLIRFKGLEENSRVFEFRLYTVLSSFFRIEREAHIAILAMLEKEGIDSLYVRLETTPEEYQQQMKALNN